MPCGRIGMLRVAFAGTFSATLEPAVRARLQTPCDVVLGDETGIVTRLSDGDVCAIRRDVTRSGADGLSLLGGPEALDEVLRRADYLAVTLSLSDQTRGLLGARELALMKPTARLVNVARAEIVDEDALYRALADRRLAGPALDG